MECKVKVHKQNAKPVTNPVRGARVLCGHGSQARCGNNNPDKTCNVHFSTRIDLVVKPGTKRVVNDT